jgi:hypothetical protein
VNLISITAWLWRASWLKCALRQPVIAAGLLHDTVEDTAVTLSDIRRDFGDEIASLVDGVTKLTQLPRVSRGDQFLDDNEREEEARQFAQRRGVVDTYAEADERSRSRNYDLGFRNAAQNLPGDGRRCARGVD